MPYGSVLTDNVQSSTANTPTVFKDGNGTQIGTLCRAWVNFDASSGTGCTVRASFNVSSVTYNTTTSYNVNFTNAMPDANYAIQYISGTNQTPYIYNASQTPTASTCRLSLGGATNPVYNCVSVFR